MNIDNLIPSKDMKDYLQEIGHEFTDFEKATIIYNLSANISVRNKKLVALQQETSDGVLRTQIQERLEYDHKELEQFYNTENGKYIMVVFGKCECNGKMEENPIGYFTDGKLAEEYARTCLEAKGKDYAFRICKQRLITRKEELQESVKTHGWRYYNGKGELFECDRSTFGEDASIEGGELGYSKEGELKFSWVNELVDGEEKIQENYCERFEDHFVKIPHPFKVGDHVRIAGTQDTGIISHILNEKDFSHVVLDWIDAAVITVDYDDTVEDTRTEYGKETGFIAHTHEHPMCIERG